MIIHLLITAKNVQVFAIKWSQITC